MNLFYVFVCFETYIIVRASPSVNSICESSKTKIIIFFYCLIFLFYFLKLVIELTADRHMLWDPRNSDDTELLGRTCKRKIQQS